MDNTPLLQEDKAFTRRGIDTAIKIGAIILVLTWCFQILQPFLLPIIWAAILAIALFPLYNKLSKLLGGRDKWAAIIIALIGIAILVVPTVKFSSSAIDSLQQVSAELKEGTLSIPPPNESIKEWPIVGEKTYVIWAQASTDLEQFIATYSTQIKNASSNIFSAIAGFGGSVLQFIISIIIAAAFMLNAKPCARGCSALMRRLMDESGDLAVTTSIATIRSVAVGILGIAITQALLSGAGLMIADIPAAGVWVLLVLLLAIVQLPPILILGPISAYYFSVADTTPAIIFLVWNIIVSSSDAVLKPLFLGRGMDTPMLVILLGAIGGMMLSGIIGLFVGAVILALGYQLMMDWLAAGKNTEANEVVKETK
jgi:predicted PurR-regulated permease PerM